MALDSETLNQLCSTVRRFVDERLIPLESQVADDDLVPPEVVDEMRELGLFGLSTPSEYGGLGLTMSEEAQVVFEISRTSPAFRSVFGTNVSIGSQGLVMGGTEEQKQRYLPRVASGELIASFALTEPQSGSDAASIRTHARREGDDYLINGRKLFITNAPEAGLFTVFVRTGPKETGTRGISTFLIEADNPGLSVGPWDKKMGQHGAHTADVIFEDCRVPADALLGGEEGSGFKTAMKVLDRGRIHLGAVCVGLAERLIDDSLRYAMEREQFDHPIAEFQLVQAMLADSKAEAYAARCMVEETARRKDAGIPVATEASCCKFYCSEMAGRVADRAVQIMAGRVIWRNTESNVSIATCGCFEFMKAPVRSSSWSSREI